MAEFIVNITLIAAVLILLGIWAVSASRRRADRREHAAERRLILAAFTGAAAPATLPEAAAEEGEIAPATVRPARRAARTSPPPAPLAQQPIDATSVAALIDLLENRWPARHGMIAGLFTSPRSVWSAGTRAGQTVGQRSMGDPRQRAAADRDTGSGLYRDAANELVDIHAHDPADAHTEYTRYAAALGDPALAELYVRSAAYATTPTMTRSARSSTTSSVAASPQKCQMMMPASTRDRGRPVTQGRSPHRARPNLLVLRRIPVRRRIPDNASGQRLHIAHGPRASPRLPTAMGSARRNREGAAHLRRDIVRAAAAPSRPADPARGSARRPGRREAHCRPLRRSRDQPRPHQP